MAGQRSFYREMVNFQLSPKTSPYDINRSEMKISSSCFLLIYEHEKMLLWYLDQIVVTHSNPEGKNVTFPG